MVIQVQGVSKQIDGRSILREVSFNVEEGEILGLLGPNGAGKTTLLRLILGLGTPDEGRISIWGMEYRRASQEIRRRVGFVPDKVNLDPNFTALQNLVLHGELFQLPRRELRRRALELLGFFQLEDRADAALAELSHGMTRKLLIARALIAQPQVLILDEPTLGLDPEARRDLAQVIRRLNQDGLTILLSTQSLVTAQSLCHRLAVLRAGRLIRLAPTREFLEAGELDEVWIELRPGEEARLPAVAEELGRLPGVSGVELAEDRLVVALPRCPDTLAGLLICLAEGRVPLRSLTVNQPDFEAAFIRLMQQEKGA